MRIVAAGQQAAHQSRMSKYRKTQIPKSAWSVYLGSRSSGGYGAFLRESRATSRDLRKVEESLGGNRPARIAVAAAIEVIAANEPTIGTLLSVYRLSTTLYAISNEAYKEYLRTGDTDAAMRKAGEMTMGKTAQLLSDHIASSLVDVGWEAIKKRGGFHTTELEDRILTSAAKSTLKEVLPA